jgi:hypothetical protein
VFELLKVTQAMPLPTGSQIRRVLPLIPILILSGCGGGTQIEGSVTLDGKPVEDGTIAFSLVGGKDATVGGPVKNGKYSLESSRKLTPGTYRVEINWLEPTGKKVENKSDKGTEVEERKQLIPMKYNLKSELTTEIKSGSNSANFELKSGGEISAPGVQGSKQNKVKAVGD